MILSAIIWLLFSLCAQRGLSVDFQCSSQISMDPETGTRPQYVGENPPPYSFFFLRDNGEASKRYTDALYTIRLNASSSYFRGFLIQARLATKHGHIVGGYRAGEFLLDDTSKQQGVKFLDCPSVLNDSITHSNDDKKTVIEAKWIDKRREGPIQFLITVIQELETYWISWAPKSGLIFPAKRTPGGQPPSAQVATEPPVSSKEGKVSSKESRVSSNEKSSGVNGEEVATVADLPKDTPAAKKVTAAIRVEKPADENEGEGNDSPKEPTSPPAAAKSRIIHKEKVAEEEVATSAPDIPKETTAQPTVGQPEEVVPTTEQPVPDKIEGPEKISESKGLAPEEAKTNERFIVSSGRGNQPTGSGERKPPVEIKILTPAEEAPRGDGDQRSGPKHLSGAEVPQHIIQEHILEVAANVTDPPELDMCANEPCLHNGSCESFPGERRFQCTCNSEWVGEQCEEKNLCFNNDCKNGAACVLGDGDYTCQCQPGFGGPRCEANCPAYLCKNGGLCIIGSPGDYRCNCKPGWTGPTCEKEADACSSNPCQNDGNCTNKITSFSCKCKVGYMGEMCHRACQDVYKSCDFWKQEDKCDQMRPTTSFFDINCPVSCAQCAFDNSTIKTKTPLPFLLEPFAFLIGTWYANYSSTLRYPIDFDFAPEGYSEELSFIVPPVNMFGTPYLNYSSKAINKAYGISQVNLGFVTLKPVTDPLKIAIMSTGNDGITMIEEGDIKPNILRLASKFMLAHPSLEKVPLKLSRRFYYDGNYLEEKITRVRADTVTETFTRYYTKHVVKPFF